MSIFDATNRNALPAYKCKIPDTSANTEKNIDIWSGVTMGGIASIINW